jgi:predicted transcriptional regulator
LIWDGEFWGNVLIVNKPVIDVVFSCEERKNILLFLKSGPQETEFILESLEMIRQDLLPHMRVLEDSFLVTRSEDVWELTTIGKLMVSKMISLLSTADVLDSDIDYWGSHRLDLIPSHLIKRMDELGMCKVINTPLSDADELNREIIQTSFMSGSLFAVTAFFDPKYLASLSDLAQKNVSIYIIISKTMLDKAGSQCTTCLEKLVKNRSVHFYVYPKKMAFQDFMYNDYYLLLHLLKNNGGYDNKGVLCSNPLAAEWGKDLFGYYLEDSIPVTQIRPRIIYFA